MELYYVLYIVIVFTDVNIFENLIILNNGFRTFWKILALGMVWKINNMDVFANTLRM
jgi:hypothetical protein